MANGDGNGESLRSLIRMLHTDLGEVRVQVGKLRDDIGEIKGANRVTAAIFGFLSGTGAYVIGKLFF